MFHFMDILHLLMQSSVDVHFGYFYFLAIWIILPWKDKFFMNTYFHFSSWELLGHMLASKFLKNCLFPIWLQYFTFPLAMYESSKSSTLMLTFILPFWLQYLTGYKVVSHCGLIYIFLMTNDIDFPGGLDSKESAYNAGDLGSIAGSGRSLGEGNGNPLQYSCLENPRHGPRRLVGYSPWGHKESDTTERLHFLSFFS